MLQWRKPLVGLLSVGLGFCVAAGGAHAQLKATIRQATGELRLTNIGTEDFNLTAYRVTFPEATLTVDDWLPIAGRLDINGDMSFDSDNAWTIVRPLDPLPQDANELFEGVFVGTGGLLAPNTSVYLGSVWNPSDSPDIEVEVVGEGMATMNAAVSYIPVGDYTEDGIVDQVDYEFWKYMFGSTGVGLLADGNLDQVVDLADYTLWRDNLGATSFSAEIPPLALATTISIPEPGGLAIVSFVSLLGVLIRRSQYA